MSTIGERLKILRKSYGYTQEELAKKIGVTKTTISQWEKGKTEPKNANLILLIETFDTTYEWFRLGRSVQHNTVEIKDSLTGIPFYNEVFASAGNGCENSYECFTYINIKELPPLSNPKSLICIRATGDSMMPFIQDGALLILDTDKKPITDGKIYVFSQDDSLRVKQFCYSKNGINIRSYNDEYRTEFYTHQEINKLNMIGRVVWYSSSL